MGAWIETPVSISLLPSVLASHPMWVRGLKLLYLFYIYLHTLVAPHVGAWIETLQRGEGFHSGGVAPHVGAWIETIGTEDLYSRYSVAPHVGAWIETFGRGTSLSSLAVSHPMWVRGLKQEKDKKLAMNMYVAPHVGAWIETCW